MAFVMYGNGQNWWHPHGTEKVVGPKIISAPNLLILKDLALALVEDLTGMANFKDCI